MTQPPAHQTPAHQTPAHQTRAPERAELPSWLSTRGRYLYGSTQPGQAIPCARTSPLTDSEVAQVAALIFRGRSERHAEVLPEELRTRDWPSVIQVLLALDRLTGRTPAGWKIGAASAEIREAEGLPGPSPGLIYSGTVFPSGSELPPELFINYRNCECEFAIELAADFPVRDRPYTEADARAGIGSVFGVLELGDSVFPDWYGSSSYFGTCLDNGGGAALITGTKIEDWAAIDLSAAGMDVYLDGYYLKSGRGSAAMGHPVTSLTWMLNWAREQGRDVAAGQIISTGTCTGHLFADRGDTVTADFGELGTVEVRFG
jgi:2-keto-4-pentenoate hydratase